jgi:hypothetical protein
VLNQILDTRLAVVRVLSRTAEKAQLLLLLNVVVTIKVDAGTSDAAMLEVCPVSRHPNRPSVAGREREDACVCLLI